MSPAAVRTVDEELAHLRSRYADARDNLLEAVIMACPGVHQPLPHRDTKPPWCMACGRTEHGIRVDGRR